jgi:hypothetical protein
MPIRDAGRIVLVGLMTGGCATMIHGTTQTVEIRSTPPGATATITPGDVSLVTPATVTLSREGGYVVRMTREGYRPKNGYIDRDVSGARWGNLGFGGMVGMMVDHDNGAAYNLTPNPLDVVLEPLDASASQ